MFIDVSEGFTVPVIRWWITDDGGSKLLWNVGLYLSHYTALHTRRQPSSRNKFPALGIFGESNPNQITTASLSIPSNPSFTVILQFDFLYVWSWKLSLNNQGLVNSTAYDRHYLSVIAPVIWNKEDAKSIYRSIVLAATADSTIERLGLEHQEDKKRGVRSCLTHWSLSVDEPNNKEYWSTVLPQGVISKCHRTQLSYRELDLLQFLFGNTTKWNNWA
jgi:hypothetical protein